MRQEQAPRLEGEMTALVSAIKRDLRSQDYSRLEEYRLKYNASVDLARPAWPLCFPSNIWRLEEFEEGGDPRKKIRSVMKAAQRLADFLGIY